ncbi:MAG TPA: VWA domain-containing protein [Thioploca sp.]|nr:VWA domain-containing protein [Thioploca sp.]
MRTKLNTHNLVRSTHNWESSKPRQWRNSLALWIMAGSLVSFPFGASSEKMDFLSLQLKGNASTLKTPDGVVLRLTPAKHNQIGTAFTNNKLNIAAGFSTFFTFRITKPIYIKGGDGIVFVVQSEQSNVLIEGESDIGYAKILKSVGVEFDTWNNTAWRNDYDDNHLGINIKGDFNGPTASVAPSFNDEKIWYAWIDYDGKQLAVRTNQTGKPPEEPLLTRSLNLQEILGDTQAFVGFTSSTGGDYNNHDIVSWKFTPSYLRGNITYSPKPAILEGDSVTFKALVTETNMGVSSADASWTVKTRSGETLSISEKTATLIHSFGKAGTYIVEANIQRHPIGQATISVIEPYVHGKITGSPKPAILEGDSVTFKALVTETNMGVSSADARWTVKTRSGETLYRSVKTEKLRYSFGKADTYVVEADIQGHPIGQATISVIEPYVHGKITYSPKPAILEGDSVTFKALVTETNMGVSSTDARWTVKTQSGETLSISEKTATLIHSFGKADTYVVEANIEGHSIGQATISVIEPYVHGKITYSPKKAILEGDSVTFKALVTETNMKVSSADARWTVKTRSGETLSISEKTATLRYSFGKVDTYVVEADIEGHSIGQATILVRQMVTLTFSVPEKTSVAADIAFVLDQSYSHKDDIVIFQTKAEQIVSVFDTFGESVYYALTGFIDYSDYPYGKKGDFPYRLYQTLTDDKERFISEIKKLVIYNGGDNLESQLEAVYRTVNELKWRTGSLKIILLATDANFHDRDQKLSSPENREREKDPSYPGRGYLETLSALQKNHITVYGLGGTGRMDDLLKLSEDSSGIAYCLSVGKEQITEHISKILETLKTSGYLVLKTDNPRYVESIRPKTIDLAGLSAGDQVQFTVIFNPDTLRNEQAEFSFFLQTDKGAVLEERPFD